MIHGLVLIPKSADPKGLEAFLANRVAPGSQPAPGLRSIKVSAGVLMSPGGPPPYAAVLENSFDSLDDAMAYVQSPAARAGTDYLKSVGALILMYEVNDLPLG